MGLKLLYVPSDSLLASAPRDDFYVRRTIVPGCMPPQTGYKKRRRDLCKFRDKWVQAPRRVPSLLVETRVLGHLGDRELWGLRLVIYRKEEPFPHIYRLCTPWEQ